MNHFTAYFKKNSARALLACIFLSGVLLPAYAAEKSPEKTDETITIGFGSCIKQDTPEPFWNDLLREKLDAFLILGDTVYADSTDPLVLRRTYAKLGSEPGYQALKKITPIYAIWDDHDYGKDDAGGDLVGKEISREEFFRFFQVPEDSERRKNDGIYDEVILKTPSGKTVQILLLDTRYNRSGLKKKGKIANTLPFYVANEDAQATLLGEAQWKWLETKLLKKVDFRFLASSIQFLPENHGWEKWMNFPNERARFLALVKKTKASHLAILSGDRHFGAVYKEKAPKWPYTFLEVTSSSLNQVLPKFLRTREREPSQIVAPQHQANFAVMHVDFAEKKLRYEVRGLRGKVLASGDLPFSELEF